MTNYRLLTIEEAADFCGISPRTLENLRLAGRGPTFIRLGMRKGIRYLESDIVAWLESRRFFTGGPIQVDSLP